MSDSELIQLSAVDELAWDAKVNTARIAATANENIVILSGWVKSADEKVAAQQAVQRVRGVASIVNHLEVRPEPEQAQGDEAIAEAAVLALRWNAEGGSGANVKAVVSEGWIELVGEVGHFEEREAAEQAVTYLDGVRGVTNLLEVVPPLCAERVKDKIDAAFVRDATTDAEQVHVDVIDRTAILTGCVHSWREKQEARRAAWAVPGVGAVIDELEVEALASSN